MYNPKSYVGLMQCFYCGEARGVLLDRHLRDSLPNEPIVYDTQPCSECEEHMRQGIILISVKDGEDEKIERDRLRHLADPQGHRRPFIPNPYRTGLRMVVAEEFIRRALDEKTADMLCKSRWAFIPDEAAEKLGLAAEARRLAEEKEKETQDGLGTASQEHIGTEEAAGADPDPA